ncbi:hypothetical protein BGLA2_1870005 [Burkholderia gladioli]|nr:hypothetical protein BGLA2_1870005 [Burkholderia gladioli]
MRSSGSPGRGRCNFFVSLFHFQKLAARIMFLLDDTKVLKETKVAEESNSGCSLAW